jgi:predicted O-methyltransferase YrrM
MTQTAERLGWAREAASTVEGWLTAAEGELLFSAAADCPRDGTIVEIGSWKGKSTTWLARGAGDDRGIRVFAVDPHEPYLEDPLADSLGDFHANMGRLGLTRIVTLIVARSEVAALSFDAPIDVLFIDGDHEEAAVALDLALWLPKLRAGGLLAMHDVRNRRWRGVSRELSRLLWRSSTLGRIRFADSMAAVTRVARSSFRERLRNRWLAICLRAYAESPELPRPLVTMARRIVFRS